MSTCAPTAASPPEPHRGRPPLVAAAALLATLLLSAGCAGGPKRPTPAPPVADTPVPARPKPPPARPAPPPPIAPVATPPPQQRNFAQEKAARKLQLSGDARNAIAPSEVGYYLDVLVGRLRQSLGPDTGVARHGQHVVVVLPASAGFPVGATALPAPLRAKLAPLARTLLEYRRVLVGVSVRADASVIGASNPRLAEQRAQVIAAYLGGAGIDARRILLAPAGPSRPAASAGGAGRSRIEIQLEPIVRSNARARSR